jgi:alpha-1,2-mannosyltransferase
MIGAEPSLSVPVPEAASRRGGRRLLLIAGAALTVALAAYLADFFTHPLRDFFDWFDLRVYNHAGLIARHSPARLYVWQLRPGIKFTYTPFAAVLFAACSLLPWAVLRWVMTAASLAALAMTAWVTFGALGWRHRRRLTGLLALMAVTVWLEPVQRALHLGQIELLLMYLIVWDLCQNDRRWWKGAGIGIAAGIKLVPLIFIPYLVLSGRLRQAAAASIAFGATIGVGFVFLPGQSVKWWLTGYFLRVGKAGDPASMLNQSLFGMMARAEAGPRNAHLLWLCTDIVVAVAGVVTAAMLHRAGQLVAGWLTCALTGLLVSPISWDQHWVWIVPAIALAADAAARHRGRARLACLALAAGIAVVFADWPDTVTGARAFVPKGLLGIGPAASPGRHLEYRLAGIENLTWNLYLVAGLVMLAIALGAAIRAWRGRVAAERDPAPLAGVPRDVAGAGLAS